MYRMFLLSPAHCGGRRAQLIFSANAQFDLARRLHAGESAPIAEIYTFLSGLYFRGKIAYARQFGNAPDRLCAANVITPDRGLLDADTPITLEELRAFGCVDIHEADDRYRLPLERSVRNLVDSCPDSEVVLLGSIASQKYVDVLLGLLGERLLFPADFVGRGDLSRGGLLLRAADAGKELEYTPVLGAVRRGKRPPRLVPISKFDPQ